MNPQTGSNKFCYSAGSKLHNLEIPPALIRLLAESQLRVRPLLGQNVQFKVISDTQSHTVQPNQDNYVYGPAFAPRRDQMFERKTAQRRYARESSGQTGYNHLGVKVLK